MNNPLGVSPSKGNQRESTRHNIHIYPYFLFAAIHHLKASPTVSVRPRSSVARVTEDLFRRSWVRFPPKSKDFFFASCGSLIPFTRANAQWVIHGFKKHFNLHFRVNSLFHYLCSSATRHNIHFIKIVLASPGNLIVCIVLERRLLVWRNERIFT